MIPSLFYRLAVLTFGTLLPCYSSFKAIKNRDTREYARWMMYWICFGMFSAAEVFTDIIFIWLPFYYEIKILFILWLMSSYGNGARIMYRNLIHPQLDRRENVIDSYITSAQETGVSFAMHFLRKSSDTLNTTLSQLFYYTQVALIQQLQTRTQAFTSPLFPLPLPTDPTILGNHAHLHPPKHHIPDQSPKTIQIDQNDVQDEEVEFLGASFSTHSFEDLTEIYPSEMEFQNEVVNNNTSSAVTKHREEKEPRRRRVRKPPTDGLSPIEVTATRTRRKAALKARECFKLDELD